MLKVGPADTVNPLNYVVWEHRVNPGLYIARLLTRMADSVWWVYADGAPASFYASDGVYSTPAGVTGWTATSPYELPGPSIAEG